MLGVAVVPVGVFGLLQSHCSLVQVGLQCVRVVLADVVKSLPLLLAVDLGVDLEHPSMKIEGID